MSYSTVPPCYPFVISFCYPQSWNFIKKEALAQVFSCEFCETFKNIFFIEHLRWLLLSEKYFFCWRDFPIWLSLMRNEKWKFLYTLNFRKRFFNKFPILWIRYNLKTQHFYAGVWKFFPFGFHVIGYKIFQFP